MSYPDLPLLVSGYLLINPVNLLQIHQCHHDRFAQKSLYLHLISQSLWSTLQLSHLILDADFSVSFFATTNVGKWCQFIFNFIDRRIIVSFCIYFY